MITRIRRHEGVIVYGTRGCATKAIADEIGEALIEQGYGTTVRDARDAKGVDARALDLISCHGISA